MSLRRYRSQKLVAFSPSASVRDVARSIETNAVGAIVIQENGRVIGIVTDRDLATRVLGAALDPKLTSVGTVMSSPVAVLTSNATQTEALTLMEERRIRRIPLVEDGHLVGMVTLDDLLLDETVPVENVAGVVERQIGTQGIPALAQYPAAERSAGRARSTFELLRSKVRSDTSLGTPEQAETALNIVISALVKRLTPQESESLISEMPSLLRPYLRTLPPGPNNPVTRQSIELELSQRLDVGPQRAAEILNAVGGSISEWIDPDQVDEMRGHLPEELRSILPRQATA